MRAMRVKISRRPSSQWIGLSPAKKQNPQTSTNHPLAPGPAGVRVAFRTVPVSGTETSVGRGWLGSSDRFTLPVVAAPGDGRGPGAPALFAPCTHFAVAAGILPAVEPGVPPGGKTLPCPGRLNYLRVRLKPGRWTRRQDAASYGRRDARRYNKAAPSRWLQLKSKDAYKVQIPAAFCCRP
jgi:hypothetical protein